MRQLKLSEFNEWISCKQGTAIYNTFTGRMLYIPYVMLSKVLEIDMDTLEKTFSEDTIHEMTALGMLIPVEKDELAELDDIEREGAFGAYLNLTILPTEKCNFRCIYCYEQYKRDKMKEQDLESVVSFAEKKLPAYKGLIVSWFGGEPLEAIDVIEKLSEQLIDLCKEKGKIYQAGMTTNGYALTVPLIKKLMHYRIYEYQITLDGLGSSHDKQRPLENGSPTFQTIINNLMDIKQNVHSPFLHIVLRTNFTKKMVESAGEFGVFLDEHFLDDSRFDIFWQAAEDYGFLRDDGLRAEFLTSGEYKELIRNHALVRRSRTLEESLYPNGSVCYAMKNNAFVIAADGVIKKCTCELEKAGNMFGSIQEGIDHKRLDYWLHRTIKEQCQHCKKRPLCHGRACYKTNQCPPNLFFYKDVLRIMAEKEEQRVLKEMEQHGTK